MNNSHYLNTATYNEMLDRLADVRPTLNQPCLRSAIMEILGEIGDVWPIDIVAHEQEQALV